MDTTFSEVTTPDGINFDSLIVSSCDQIAELRNILGFGGMEHDLVDHILAGLLAGYPRELIIAGSYLSPEETEDMFETIQAGYNIYMELTNS